MADDKQTPLGDSEEIAPTTPAGAPEIAEQSEPTDGVVQAVEPSHEPQVLENAQQADVVPVGKFPKLKRFTRAYWARKKWTLPLTVVLLVALLLGIPLTRYPILGMVLKKDAAVTVIDSVNDQPVTDAMVEIDGQTFKTDNHGRAVAHLGVGKHTVSVTKKYYKSYDASIFVPITKTSSLSVKAVATGRQVPITVSDFVTGRPLENAVITASGSSAKTDKQGKATLVLPAQDDTAKATIVRDGYNESPVSVLVTARAVTTNQFKLTPVGKLYFLSNQSGKIDVVKTDLDGKNRKTVLAGTGSEDTYTTSLLASRDWKYLALLSKRDGKPGIYVIDTGTDKATNIDGGNANASFTLVGWSGTTFVYQVQRGNLSNWQPGTQVIKSYDATTGKLFTLDQSQGEGSSTFDYGYTNYSAIALLESEVVFVRNWYGTQAPDHLSGKSSSFVSVRPDGTSKKTVKEFPIPAGTSYGYTVGLSQYEPYGVYLQAPNGSDGTYSYYEYEDGSLAAKNDVTDDTWNKTYPTYLISPTGKQTFWTEVRDNKNTLFVGNSDGGSGKQIASLSSFTPYGWYSDNYLLVSKNGSELHVMPADGSKAPIKLTDYYRPQTSYRGYGGGYGGI